MLRSRLHRRGRRFRKNAQLKLANGNVNVDILFSGPRVAVFIDGCFWHGCPSHGSLPKANAAYWSEKIEDNHRRDRRVDEALAASGWRVLRIWEHEEAAEAVLRIERALDAWQAG